MAAAATRTRKSTRAARPKADSAEPKYDAYQVITDKVVEMLESGVAPWRQSWDADAGAPRSMSTRKLYRGINPFVLQMATMVNGYGSPWWGTYRQIEALGGQVRKGEQHTKVVYWKFIPVIDEATGRTKTIPFLRTFNVFNADQADGELKLPELSQAHDHDPIAECDEAVAAYLATGPKLVIGGNQPCYIPSLDTVHQPELSAFDTVEEYYAALFHELTHSTGHKSRLNRPGLMEGHSFGDEVYSKEELVAELGSAFLSAMTGIAVEPMSNSVNYLASWIKVLKGDKKLLVQAAAQAQKAADLLLGVVYAKDEPKTEAAA